MTAAAIQKTWFVAVLLMLIAGCAAGDPEPLRSPDGSATATASADQTAANDATNVQAAADGVGPSDAPASPHAATPAASFRDVVRLSLPGDAEDYAYDPQTGDLAVIGPWRNHIGIASIEAQHESGTLRQFKYVALRGRPHKLAHIASEGRAVFAVSQSDPNGVFVIDVQSREIVKAIKLGDKPASFVPAVGAATLQLYFTTSNRQGDNELFRLSDGTFRMPADSTIEIQRLNVDTMDLEPPIHISHLNTSGHAVMNDTTLYYWRGFDITSVHASGRYSIYMNRIYDRAFAHSFTEVQCAPKTFLAGGPWVAGVTRDQLVVCSINDGRIVTGVPIPSGYHRVAELFFDADRALIVAGLGRHVLLVPLDKLELPDEPILLFEQRPATVAELKGTYEFPLVTVSGDPKVTLTEGPEGMKIEGKVLRWRPETAYTGPVDVKLEITAGDVTRRESWQITVE